MAIKTQLQYKYYKQYTHYTGCRLTAIKISKNFNDLKFYTKYDYYNRWALSNIPRKWPYSA